MSEAAPGSTRQPITPHRTCAILAIGDELVIGQKLDSNSQWLSGQLLSRGIRPIEHATVDDDENAITQALIRLGGRADLVLVSGGLGPTADDLTRTALARAMDDELVRDEEALSQIRGWYESRGRTMPPANAVQADRPSRAWCMSNDRGTAPGLGGTVARQVGAVSCDSFVDVYCLPGPPHELKAMFERHVVPRLRPPADSVILTRVIQSFGLGESDVAGLLGPLMARDRVPVVGTTASVGVVSVRIRHEAPGTPERGRTMLDETEALVRERLGGAVFGVGEDLTLETCVIERLRAHNARLAVVESCTGGMLGQILTSVPGSSDVFLGGWITYTNELKHSQVGVPSEVFEPSAGTETSAPGAVSEQCVRAMASGGLERADADFALSISGIAGPGGETPGKPVGTVWIGLASRHIRRPFEQAARTEARGFLFRGGREQIRLWAARSALGMLRLRLDGIEMRLLGESEA